MGGGRGGGLSVEGEESGKVCVGGLDGGVAAEGENGARG